MIVAITKIPPATCRMIVPVEMGSSAASDSSVVAALSPDSWGASKELAAKKQTMLKMNNSMQATFTDASPDVWQTVSYRGGA